MNVSLICVVFSSVSLWSSLLVILQSFNYLAYLATEQKHLQLITVCINQTTGLTSGRAADCALEVVFSPFRALYHHQQMFLFCC